MSSAKLVLILAVQLLFIWVNAAAYECVDDRALPGDQIFEHDGHCLSAKRLAWLATPTYFVQVVPWSADGQPVDLASFYGVLLNGMSLWNQYQYQNFTNPPAHYALATFQSPWSGDGISTISFTNNIGPICGSETSRGCEIGRRGSPRTEGFGGIDRRLESDIYIRGEDWTLSGFTIPCDDNPTFAPDIRSVINHEIGHGLGTAHMISQAFEPFPIMHPGGAICDFQPVIKELGDVDHLYELTPGANRMQIQSPPSMSAHPWLGVISFFATAFDSEGADVSDQLRWISSMQGLIGNGQSFVTSELRPGRHTISLDIPEPDNAGSNDETNLIIGAGIHFGYRTIFESSRGTASSIPMPTREGTNDFPSSIIIDVNGPVVTEFVASNNPCFIEIGGDTCQTQLSWNIENDGTSGEAIVFNSAAEVIGSGLSGTASVSLVPGDNLFDLSFRDENNEDHLLSTLDAFAGEISGGIIGPGQCEIDPPPDDLCSTEIELAGFARQIILYDMGRGISLFELDAGGLFSTTYSLDVPIDGIQIGLYSDNVTPENLLAEKSISTFRIADQYEDDDFVSRFESFGEIDALQMLPLGDWQLGHNFHKEEDVDYIRIPWLSDLALSSIRTRNVSAGLTTNIDIGCIRRRSGAWQFESVDFSIVDGPWPGSVVANTSNVFYPSDCRGDPKSYIARISGSWSDSEEVPRYDVLFIDGIEDHYEPDDFPSEAQEIRLNELQERNFFSSRDDDWLKFSPDSPGYFELHYTGSTNPLLTPPCISISSSVSDEFTHCFDSPPFESVQFFANGETLIRLDSRSVAQALDYTVEIKTFSVGPDRFEEDDGDQIQTFVFGPGSHTQYRNFVDDSADYFRVRCDCSGNGTPLTLAFRSFSTTANTTACIELSSRPYISIMRLCDGSMPGPNSDYYFHAICDC